MTRAALLTSLVLLAACASAPPAPPIIVPAAPPPAPAADEREPQTWVGRLDDHTQREVAVDRLTQLFEDARSSSPATAEKLRDVFVTPLAAIYPATPDMLAEPMRKKILALLVSTGDRRAAPAYARAFNSFVPGSSTGDIAYAARGTAGIAASGQPVDAVLVEALWSCFAAFRPSQSRSINVVQDIHRAVLAVKAPSYGPRAAALLEVPLKTPPDRDETMDLLQFRQTTAARLVGELRFVGGVSALVTVLLTPAKADLHFPVRSALTRMPKDSEPVLIAALSARATDKMTAGRVADVLAAISRPAGRDAIVRALEKAGDDTDRTMLALALTRFPRDERSIKAFKAAYAKIPATLDIAAIGGSSAHAVLVGAAASFYDPSLTEWLLKAAAAAKGERAEMVTAAALKSAITLMPLSSSGAVAAAVKKLPGVTVEAKMYEAAAAVLTQCNQEPVCYLSVLDAPDDKLRHTKAAAMAAIHGTAATRDALVGKLAAQKDSSVRLAILEAITHLSPSGDDATATKLEQLIADQPSTSLHDDMYRVALKLRARVP